MVFKDVYEFQKAYPSKEDKEKALMNMSDEDIDHLISTCSTPQAKIFYSSFKKNKRGEESSHDV